jgi:hypothetical protein
MVIFRASLAGIAAAVALAGAMAAPAEAGRSVGSAGSEARSATWLEQAIVRWDRQSGEALAVIGTTLQMRLFHSYERLALRQIKTARNELTGYGKGTTARERVLVKAAWMLLDGWQCFTISSGAERKALLASDDGAATAAGNQVDSCYGTIVTAADTYRALIPQLRLPLVPQSGAA